MDSPMKNNEHSIQGFVCSAWNGTIRGHSFAIDINLQDLSIKNGHWLIRFKFKFPILCHFSRLATTGKLIDGDDDDDNYFDDDWTWNSDRKPGLLGLVSTSSRHILVTFFSIQVQWTCCFSQIKWVLRVNEKNIFFSLCRKEE